MQQQQAALRGLFEEIFRMRTGNVPVWPSAPYVRSRISTGDLMYLVVLALLPCAGVGLYHYGFHAALLVGISVAAALLSEFLCGLVWHKGASVLDYSCIVTGLVGGLILPPSAPYWMGLLQSVLAIVVFKYLFGGLGRNLFNPAMAAKCVLLVVFRSIMLDTVTSTYTEETPLTLLAGGETPDLLSMIAGNTPGYIGTSSAAAVLAGAVILYLTGIIDLVIPLSAIAGFSVCYILIGRYGLSPYTLGVQLCGGSFLFTVFFMAEDFTTSPVSARARTACGLILGVLVFIFRRAGFVEDACVYSLLIVNALRPLLDRVLPQAYFGAASSKWVVRETQGALQKNGERTDNRGKNERTNEDLDAEFERFERQIERETRGLETARYTGDDTLLRQAFAEAERYTYNTEEEEAGVRPDGYAGIGSLNPDNREPEDYISEHEKQVRRERGQKRNRSL